MSTEIIIENVSPIGDLDVPLLRRIVKAGDVVEVSEDHARRLLAQADNFAPASVRAEAIAAELLAEALLTAEPPGGAPVDDTASDPEGATE